MSFFIALNCYFVIVVILCFCFISNCRCRHCGHILVERRIVEEVRKNDILIIVGETGSGKTTRKFFLL